MNRFGALALVLALAPAFAFAIDGVTLINQSTVLAMGGFPYSIAQSGSYKLTGNLVVPSLFSGIVISVSDVTLDLNGFTITGASQGFAGMPSTALIKTVGAVHGVTVRNGVLHGVNTSQEISFASATASLLENLRIYDETGGNMSFFGSSVVRGITNPGGSPIVTCPALVVDSLAFSWQRSQISSTACSFGFISGTVL